jgi:signal transduction histidine kinase/ligand-binding sensor domain-containing protein
LSSEFAIETWRTDNGLPQNTVTAVLQTRRGYIWAATYNGIVQFDGVRFKVFDSSNTKGLANSRVTTLHEDAAGNVWIGHDTGEVTHCSKGIFNTVTVSENWGRNPVKDFAEDEHGDLWVLNQLGEALRLKDGRIAKPPGSMAQDAFVNPRVVMDGKRNVYVVRNGVVALLTPVGYEVVNFRDASEQPFYAGIAVSRDGNLWVAGEGRLRKWSGTNWLADIGEFRWTDASVTTMLETSSGRLMVGTLQQGLLVFDADSGWSYLNRTNGLPQDWICDLEEDSEKNLWVGTGGGLALLRERKVTMLSPPDDWQGRPVLSITRTHDGAVWAATEGAGVYRFLNGQWSKFPVSNPFVWSVFEDSRQQLWAGTWGGGLFRLENGAFVQLTNLVQVTEPVTALKESPPGTMWIGTGAGLARLRDSVIERFMQFGGAAAGDMRTIETGNDGEIWVGTQGAGLGCVKNGMFKSYQVSDGLPGNFVLSLCADADGTLWIGTLDMGLCRFRDGQFHTITTANGLPANIIYHIEDDQLGYLWFNSPHGLFRVSKQNLNACADGRVKALEVLSYGKAEGMITLVGTGGFTPSGFRTPDGQLWFPTARGIAVVSPKTARLNPVPPHVWIEDVQVDGEGVSIGEESAAGVGRGDKSARSLVVLQPGRRQLDVQFTGLSFTSPDRVQFKYRLQGLDADWMPASARRRVTYSFLPPGEYLFHVTACNNDGVWSEKADTLAIVVLPHFWQTWWFKTLVTVGGVIFLGLVFFLESRRRLRRRLERMERQRAVERERSRIAQDIHDNLGASLTRISLLSQTAHSELEDHSQAATQLERIYSTTRDLTRAMDEIVWAVNPQHDTLDSLASYLGNFAQEFVGTLDIRCRLDVPMQLPQWPLTAEVRHNLFLAFKEALHNVVKHADASEVYVSLTTGKDGFTLIVRDNGKGFALDQRAEDVPPAAHGNGLINMRQRLEKIGGRFAIHSAPGKGTEVEFVVGIALKSKKPTLKGDS